MCVYEGETKSVKVKVRFNEKEWKREQERGREWREGQEGGRKEGGSWREG